MSKFIVKATFIVFNIGLHQSKMSISTYKHTLLELIPLIIHMCASCTLVFVATNPIPTDERRKFLDKSDVQEKNVVAKEICKTLNVRLEVILFLAQPHLGHVLCSFVETEAMLLSTNATNLVIALHACTRGLYAWRMCEVSPLSPHFSCMSVSIVSSYFESCTSIYRAWWQMQLLYCLAHY